MLANEAPPGRAFRIGGMVEAGSLKRQDDGLTVRFNVTDTAKTVPVVYKGILPDLFREGKGVVAQGQLGTDGVFEANQVLAKHDENYMPPEAAMRWSRRRRRRERDCKMSGGNRPKVSGTLEFRVPDTLTFSPKMSEAA